MAIYCRNLTGEQREWLENYEAETTFEPICQDDLENGEMTFNEVAVANLHWFATWVQETYRSVASFPDEFGGRGEETRRWRANG